MTKNEYERRARPLADRWVIASNELLTAARAAANALVDARMARTADPLNLALHELDIIDEEFAALQKEAALTGSLLDLIR